MKAIFITLIYIVTAKISLGQYQQYVQYITPYLSAPIESGYFYFNTPNNLQAGSLYQYYRINAPDLDNDMLLIDTHVDSLVGFTHYKYQQLYKGIPIEGAGCIEHYDSNGSLSFINAKIVDSIKSDGKPKLKPNEAIELLIEELRNERDYHFAWESDEYENEIKIDNNDPNATWFPEAELIFSVDTMKNMTMVISGSRYTLAYKISMTTILPFETFIYHVDANTGSILKFKSTCVNDGPANIIGYGSRIIDTQWKGGLTQAYILQTNDATRVIHTKKNPNGTTAWSLLDNTTDNNDNWGTSFDTETTTHYHVSNSWDYFRTAFGRVGQNNGGREVRVRTQWNENNADFTPEGASNNRLRFGYTSLGGHYGSEPSVVAHEFTHGVTYHSSNLEYSNESGALNESFSDIFGTVIQATMMDGGNTDWLLGNFVPNTNDYIRSLKEPSNYGSHYDNFGNLVLGQPDTYNGNFWYSGTGDFGGVHINSGVMNKWFYLLTQGEQDVNDLGDNYDITGIGMTKASRIAYLAQTSILQSSSQYTDARQATISASIMLFGECSIEHQQTVDAWYAVGIGSLNDCDYTLNNSEIIDSDLIIYPNPASTHLNIILPTITNENIEIYDMSGKLVQVINTDSLVFSFEINPLENGVYTIRFNFNGEIINKRFIHQK